MTESNNKNPETEIDLIDLAKYLWKDYKLILKYAGIGLVVGIIVAFSLPKEYTTTVKLAPEGGSNNRLSNLAGLAGLAGINLNSVSEKDGINSNIYPDVIESTPFLLEFMDMTVTTQDGKNTYSFYDYMLKEQKQAWWKHIMSAPIKLIGWIKSIGKDKHPSSPNDTIDLFNLTPAQVAFTSILKSRILFEPDKKSGIISVTVKMQDPLISAVIVDSTIQKLQRYITDYKTKKARYDLSINQQLYEQAKKNYYAIEDDLAQMKDRNRGLKSEALTIKIERQQNERDLAYTIYNQAAQQVEVSKLKLQEITPIYTILKPARIPLQATSPHKKIIVLAFIFLGAFGIVGYKTILYLFTDLKEKDDETPTTDITQNDQQS